MGDLANDIRAISDHAFPDFDDKTREQLSLDHFLGLIEKPTIVLAVCQRHAFKEFRQCCDVHTGSGNTFIFNIRV